MLYGDYWDKHSCYMATIGINIHVIWRLLGYTFMLYGDYWDKHSCYMATIGINIHVIWRLLG